MAMVLNVICFSNCPPPRISKQINVYYIGRKDYQCHDIYLSKTEFAFCYNLWIVIYFAIDQFDWNEIFADLFILSYFPLLKFNFIYLSYGNSDYIAFYSFK